MAAATSSQCHLTGLNTGNCIFYTVQSQPPSLCSELIFSFNASTSHIKTETEDANASLALQHENGIGRNKEASSDFFFESDNVLETTGEAINVLGDTSSVLYGSFLTGAVLQNFLLGSNICRCQDKQTETTK